MPNLRERFTFQRRAASAVVNGFDQAEAWSNAAADSITMQVDLQWLKGTEAVQAARLQGDQPAILTVRSCAMSRQIENGWRAVDTRDPTRILQVTAATENPSRQWMQILAVQRKGDVDG